MNDSLSVSIVVYDTEPELLNRAISALSVSIKIAVENTGIEFTGLTIVNNGPETLLIKEPSIETDIIQSTQNLGYGRAHNLAINKTNTNYHLILNPDAILNPDSLSEAVTFLRANPKSVALGPRGYSPEGNDLYLCKRQPTLLTLFLRGFTPSALQKPWTKQLDSYEYRDCDLSQRLRVELLSGCAIFSRTPELKKIGGFDSRYFLYFEDFDLSIRLQAEGELIYLPEMALTHHGGNSSQKGLRHLYYFTRSAFKFFNKFGWRWV